MFTPLVLVIIRLVALNPRYLSLEIIGTFILWDFLTYRVTCARKDGCHAHWRRWEVGSLRGLHGKCALNSVRGRDETRPFCFSSNNSSVWVYFLKTPKRPCKTLHRCSASHTPIPSRVCVCVSSLNVNNAGGGDEGKARNTRDSCQRASRSIRRE